MSSLVLWICFFAGEPPSVTLNTQYFSWEAGQTVILRCHVLSPIDVIESVFWIFETDHKLKTITPSTNPEKYRGSSSSYPSLIVLNLTSSDVGSYRCAATNKFGTGISETSLYLNVTGLKPKVTTSKHFYNAEIGANLTLEVSIYSPHSALLSVKWIFDKRIFNQTINFNSSEKYIESAMENPDLTIVNLTVDNIGNYTCIAENAYGIGKSEQIMLLIKDIPIVDICSEEYNATYGDSVTLECKVSSSNSLNAIYWERNSNGNVVNISAEFPGIQGVSIEHPGLTITVATLSDSGIYTCVAGNKYGIGRSNPTQLFVKGGIPVIKVHATVIHVTYGTNVTLHISIDSAPQHFYIYWIKILSNTTETIHNGSIGTTGGSLLTPSLTIHFPTVKDVGIYKCYARNTLGIGSSENMSLLIIGDLPLVQVQLREHTAYFGDTITINCTVRSYPYHERVYWEKRDGEEVTILTLKLKE
ncbi:HMCN [Mytilus edulis]|uniref:HMCN n=1 Tax=Mytilus edulis TaxID=6550 RepID=A0A8S3S992_MYTED|nr:HMCN [Mytilus edulis]